MIKITNRGLLILFVAAALACNHENASEQTTGIASPESLIFPKGEQITNDNFSGKAWLQNLVSSDSINQNSVGSVTFEPGAKTKWHLHPAGQIILALDGEGYYQEKGQQKRILRKGDVVKCPANVPHWHGASADRAFIQLAITGRENGPTEWLDPVTDEEYHQ